MNDSADMPPLDRLELALQAERRALLEHDMEALMQAAHDKLEALKLAERTARPEDHERIRQLHEMNRANAVLLARRRREVAWTLRYLGRCDAAPVYDAVGFQQNRPVAGRWLGYG